MLDRGDYRPVARALVVLAEDAWGGGAGIPWKVHCGDGNGRVVFQVSFTYRIGWIRAIGCTIPGTKDRIPSILACMQRKIAQSRV